jgi:flagellar biosynthesis protein FlhG
VTAHFGRQARIISVASGKGGVGKTSVAVNLAASLHDIGRRTMLIDGDLGMDNAGLMMGVYSPVGIDDVLEGRLSIDEVVTDVDGVMVLPGGSLTGAVPDFGSEKHRRISAGLRPFAHMTDFMIVDTPSGVSRFAMETAAAADVVLIVLNDEPTAFMNTFTAVKILTLDHGCTSFQVVANMVASEAAGRDLFRRFQEVVARFLTCDISLLGSIPNDRHMRDAVLHKGACARTYAHSPAALAFARIAARIGDQNIMISPGGSRFLGQEALNVVR